MDHDGHRTPNTLALPFAPDLVGLHVFQVSGLLHQVLVHSLTVSTGSLLPVHHRALIQPVGCHYSLQRTTMRNQCSYNHHQLHRVMQPVKRRSDCGRERLTAYFAFVTCFFSTMNNNVVFADFAPCGAGHIWAKLFLSVHVVHSLLVWDHKSATSPSF